MGSDLRKFGPRVTPDCEARKIQRRSNAVSHASRAAALLLACILLGAALPSAASAQKRGGQAQFLIARNEIQDPFFEHSVVVMLPMPKSPLIVGLIINKPTRVTLDKLFPDTPEFRNWAVPAYFGGPVDVRIPSVVFRSPTAPEHAVQLYGNVYLTFDYDLISKVFKNPQQASGPRMFLGRAQWSPNQLQNEIARGSWYRLQADGDLIFTSQPDSLWRILHARAKPSKYIRYRLPSGNPRAGPGKNSVM